MRNSWRYALQSHIELCGEILAVVQQEHQQLKTNRVEDVTQLQEARQGMLERLTLRRRRLCATRIPGWP